MKKTPTTIFITHLCVLLHLSNTVYFFVKIQFAI